MPLYFFILPYIKLGGYLSQTMMNGTTVHGEDRLLPLQLHIKIKAV